MMNDYVLLEIKTPRNGEESLDAMVQFLSSLASIKSKKGFFKTVYRPIFLEIVSFAQSIHFYISIPESYQVFIESQILSQYPRALITPIKENPLLEHIQPTDTVQVTNLTLVSNSYYPLKTYKDFKDIDSLSSLLGMLSKLDKDDVVVIQYLLVPANFKWQIKAQKLLEQKGKDKDAEDPLKLSVYSKQIADKISYPGFHTSIRLLVKSPNESLINLVGASFVNFNMASGNSLQSSDPAFWQRKKLIESIINRTFYLANPQILNTAEIATLFHFPGKKLETLGNVSWSKTILTDAPDNLPAAELFDEQERRNINFFARTDFKNKSTIFGIKRVDRSKHVYIIGKTGTGKSTLIANMAINDIRNGEGMAIIDPHGDLSETILNYIPANRINDVVYFNPADTSNAIHINPLQIENMSQKELISSGIVSIFYKLYANSWGPRLEYILRNTILTLLQAPNATLLQVPEILTNQAYRKKVVSNLTDPVLLNYWNNEFDKMSDSMRNEAISPILNKVGQFLSSSLIRNIVGHPKSTISLEDIMNSGKILIMNVSQGKIGEDNAALLGAMIITKLQLAAMNRVNIPEAERRDFYLYVDEFQNFATTSFIKILSEARKYRLNLTLANQYTAQIPPEIRSAIFGNAGTIISFLVGAEDAPILAREFGSRYTTDDLLALGNYQLLLKMSIDNYTSAPFFSFSLPLPNNKNENKEKIIKVSAERYAKKTTEDAPKFNNPPHDTGQLKKEDPPQKQEKKDNEKQPQHKNQQESKKEQPIPKGPDVTTKQEENTVFSEPNPSYHSVTPEYEPEQKPDYVDTQPQDIFAEQQPTIVDQEFQPESVIENKESPNPADQGYHQIITPESYQNSPYQQQPVQIPTEQVSPEPESSPYEPHNFEEGNSENPYHLMNEKNQHQSPPEIQPPSQPVDENESPYPETQEDLIKKLMR